MTPSTKCSCSGSPPILAKGKTTIERRGGADFSGASAGAGFATAGYADVERIDPDRFGDVLELGRAEIGYREIESSLDLPVGLLGDANPSGLGDPLQPRRDIDAVAHQVAVAFLDHVAEMDADPKSMRLVRRDAGVTLDHALWTSIAQFTASTTLRNSTIAPSPVRLTVRP